MLLHQPPKVRRGQSAITEGNEGEQVRGTERGSTPTPVDRPDHLHTKIKKKRSAQVSPMWFS